MQKLVVFALLASLVLLNSMAEAVCVNFEEMHAKVKAMSPEAQASVKKFQGLFAALVDKSLAEISPSAQNEIKSIMPEFPKMK